MATTATSKNTVVIDASGRSLGRVASEAATCLLGKDRPDFKPNVVLPIEVRIENASKLSIPQKKRGSETHRRYSGYPGGLTYRTWDEVIEKKGYGELVRHAVDGMLPKNKLRSRRMSNLTVTE